MIDTSRSSGRIVIALATIVVMAAISCSSPTNPGTPTPQPTPAKAPLPAPFPPFPTPPKIWTLTGAVVEESPTGPRPVMNATVSIWLDIPNVGGYAAGYAISDDAGHFSITGLPVGTARLLATADGYRQPCAVSFDLAGNTSHDVNVVFDASFVGTSLPADMSRTPLLMGIVYETTADGRLPVAGANVASGDALGIVTATTMTDASGRYQFCALPWNSDVWAWKAGYGLTDVSAPLTGASTAVDIEIRRSR